MNRVFQAFFVTLFEGPLWFITFVVVWALAWILTILALGLGILTFGRFTIPPMSESMGRILRAPKRLCLE
jgi:hypothetical protein